MSANISGGDVRARTGRELSFFNGERLEIDVGCQTVNSLSDRYRRKLQQVRATGLEPKKFLDIEIKLLMVRDNSPPIDIYRLVTARDRLLSSSRKLLVLADADCGRRLDPILVGGLISVSLLGIALGALIHGPVILAALCVLPLVYTGYQLQHYGMSVVTMREAEGMLKAVRAWNEPTEEGLSVGTVKPRLLVALAWLTG